MAANNLNTLFAQLTEQRNKCSRTASHLMVRIADEYFKTQEITSGISSLSQVLPFYKQEAWCQLVQPLVLKGLKASYTSANPADFVRFSFDYLGAWNQKTDLQSRTQLQQSLHQVLTLQCPNALDFLLQPDTNSQEILKGWITALTDQRESLCKASTNVKMLNSIAYFIEIRCQFTKPQIHADEAVNLIIHCYLHTPLPIAFSRLRVGFTNEYYNKFADLNLNQQLIEPGQSTSFKFTFRPNPQLAEQYIQIASISLQLDYGFPVIFNWSFDKQETRISTAKNQFAENRLLSKLDKFFSLPLLNNVLVLNKQSLLQLNLNCDENPTHNEQLPILLSVINQENAPISSLKISIKTYKAKCPTLESLHFFMVDGVEMEKNSDGRWVQHTFNCSLEPQQEWSKELSMQCQQFGPFTMLVSLNYTVNLPDPISGTILRYDCEKSHVLELDCTLPFQTNFLTTNLVNTNTLNIRHLEPFHLLLNCKSLLKDDIEICGLYLHLSDGFISQSHPQANLCKNLLEHPEQLTQSKNLELKCTLVCAKDDLVFSSLGSLIICWRRKSGKRSEYPENSFSVLLPELYIKPSLLYVESDIPKQGKITCAMHIRFLIHNRTDLALPIQFFIQSNDSFMFSGNNQASNEIFTLSKQLITKNVFSHR